MAFQNVRAALGELEDHPEYQRPTGTGQLTTAGAENPRATALRQAIDSLGPALMASPPTITAAAVTERLAEAGPPALLQDPQLRFVLQQRADGPRCFLHDSLPALKPAAA